MDNYKAFLLDQPVAGPATPREQLLGQWLAQWRADHDAAAYEDSETVVAKICAKLDLMQRRKLANEAFMAEWEVEQAAEDAG